MTTDAELDKLTAIHIMGWTLGTDDGEDGIGDLCWLDANGDLVFWPVVGQECWQPTRDIAQAWLICEHLNEGSDNFDTWVRFRKHIEALDFPLFGYSSQEAAMHIVKCVLAALGVQIDENATKLVERKEQGRWNPN